ncbi:mechanosensitive ion channel family protein [Nocardia pseudobrasiliensis]|uniref:Putative transporter (Transmembrane protein) n=1 Tax=Nocardia pseudobrasiliensis TaxID=45979 RepID=A0A370IBW3_9NOCA|nr:hypothetical protein [Nocardia pseudobrasiliensis]RDI66894.1 putative transporter (transmembrane protein) [Nocardia pseudobrasiliensis]
MHTSSLAIEWQQGLSNAWSSIATWVPKFVGFLLILLAGWIIATVVAKIADRILRRVGFDRLVERGGIADMLSRSRYDATDILVKLVYYAILLIALQIGFGAFGPNPISDMLNAIVGWLPRAAVAIIIVCIAGAIARAVMDLIANMLSGLSYGRMLGRIAAVFIWGVGIIAALNQIGVATSVTTPILVTVLATIGGVLVVGVGGGLIRPMQQRWEGWLDSVEGEMPQLRGHAEAFQRGREDAARQRQQVREQWARGERPSDRWMPQMANAGYGSEEDMGRQMDQSTGRQRMAGRGYDQDQDYDQGQEYGGQSGYGQQRGMSRGFPQQQGTPQQQQQQQGMQRGGQGGMNRGGIGYPTPFPDNGGYNDPNRGDSGYEDQRGQGNPPQRR